jgi:hypothetical protein
VLLIFPVVDKYMQRESNNTAWANQLHDHRHHIGLCNDIQDTFKQLEPLLVGKYVTILLPAYSKDIQLPKTIPCHLLIVQWQLSVTNSTQLKEITLDQQ